MTLTSYIALGSNLGDAQSNVLSAFFSLTQLPNTCLHTYSSLYRSAPIEASGDDYINAVACLYTQLSAHALLLALQTIEQQHGRTRPYHHAPRTLDLDILLYSHHIIKDEHLSIPHPRMTQRAFVLAPLLEIEPAIHIPGLGYARDFYPPVAYQPLAKIGKLSF